MSLIFTLVIPLLFIGVVLMSVAIIGKIHQRSVNRKMNKIVREE